MGRGPDDARPAFGHVLQTDFLGASEAGPNGENPVGSLTVSGFLNFTTQTTCLNISRNAVERLPAGAPPARVRVVGLGSPQQVGLVAALQGPTVRIRVCGAPGMALLRLTQRTSPPGRDAPAWVRGSWQDERRQNARCQVHRIGSPLGSSATGRHRITVRARTTGRRWSRQAVRMFDLG